MTEDRAVDPIKLRLANGEEHELLPRFGALRRASKKVEGGSVMLAIATLPEQAMVPLLYECLPKDVRVRMTEEDFEDELPANRETMVAVQQISELIGSSGNGLGSQTTKKPTGSNSGRKRK